MNVGGIETVLMEVYRNINREKYSFDFVVHDKKQNVFEEEINMLGGTLYRVDFFSTHPFKHIQQFNRLLTEHTEYEIIHIHTTYSIMLPDALLGKLKSRKVIIHSHNADASIKRKMFHILLKYPFDMLADYRIACSDVAAKWMFARKHIDSVFYWYNAFDVSRFKFSEETRVVIRNKFNANEKFVIGNVGRLSYQKNQALLLEIFFKIQQQCDNAILWIVGDGEDRPYLEQLTEKLGIHDKVKFFGNQKSVEDYLCAMDVYVCTSRYEGLGVSLVEAQAAGLPVIAGRQKIPIIAKISDNYITIDRDGTGNQWTEAVLRYRDYYFDRINACEKVLSSKFNIVIWIKYVEEYYQKVIDR